MMEATIQFTVNGQRRSVTTDPARPLVEVLREDLQLTGTKVGCGEGQCGSCTVLLNGRTALACQTPVAQADRQTVLTIEGLAAGATLHPIQEAFLAQGALQCGYCTPGMIMGVAGALLDKPQPTAAELRAHLEGHLCRCCGYPRILDALERVAELTRRITP
ncbi:MAG: (2Fe-2S)-binding protein [Verrucomicrobia bacterium]|nr:(2Fe-2S)-binding protein [Verrucomicrobiota bacterium]